MAGIYIHIPFCATRCIYCDFYTQTNRSRKEEYVNAVCKELELRKEYLQGEPIQTIYFGGGTPSLLSESELDKIFKAIFDNFIVDINTEITLEGNPDDLSPAYLAMLQNMPINRLSIGVQSFDDKGLKFLNRRHSAKEAIEAVKNAQSRGFNNISIDLMYGLPNQTITGWEKTINQALELSIQHISAYHLIYEEGTGLNTLLETNKINPIEEDTSNQMFEMLISRLKEDGFTQYEISNFAKDGLISKHNSSYWQGKKYLGIGTAAHSYDGVNRARNVSSISQYIEAIHDEAPNIEIEILDPQARYNDFILTGMRTIWGVDIEAIEKQFGVKMSNYFLENIKKHIDAGLVKIENSTYIITSKGIFVSDSIISDLMFV